MFTGPEEAKAPESEVAQNKATTTEETESSTSAFLERFSELKELLSSVPSVLVLLSQAADGSTTEEERQVQQEGHALFHSLALSRRRTS